MSDDHAGAERELRRAVREIHSAVIPMVDNVHKDVHGIRRDFRDATERSQTAIMNRLSLIEAKVDRISGGEVVTDADKALMAASVTQMRKVVEAAKALDEMTPT